MAIARRAIGRMVVLASLGFVLPIGIAHATDNTYVGPDGGAWDDPNNWNLGTTPASGEFAFILNASNITPFTVNYVNPSPLTSPLLGGLILSGVPGVGSQTTLIHADGDVLDTLNLQLGNVISGQTIGGIGQYDLHSGIVNVTSNPADLTSGNLVLGAGHGGVGIFNQTKLVDSLDATVDLIVNVHGTATNNTGSYGGYLFVGKEAGSFGQYNLSSAGGAGLVQLNVDNEIQIAGSNVNGFTCFDVPGQTCSGSFSQSGGEVNAGGVTIGIGPGAGASTGSYDLSGGSLNVIAALDVGNSSTGTFSQSDGVVTTHLLEVGNATGSVGTYSLSGGTLNATNVALAESSVEVGVFGTGHFIQSGGSVTAGDSMTNRGGVSLGIFGGSVGTYNFNDGILDAGNLNVGLRSQGTFTQLAGDVTLGAMIVANAVGSNGTYDMRGGALTTKHTEIIGNADVGSFDQSGGVHRVGTLNDPITGNNLILGRVEGSTGTYLLHGNGSENSPSLNVTGDLIVGGSGNGVFTQDAGDVVAGGIRLANEEQGLSPGTGHYQLHGGTVTTGVVIVGQGGRGTFDQTAGLLTTSAMNLGNNGLFAISDGLGGFLFNSHGIYNLSGGTRTTPAT